MPPGISLLRGESQRKPSLTSERATDNPDEPAKLIVPRRINPFVNRVKNIQAERRTVDKFDGLFDSYDAELKVRNYI